MLISLYQVLSFKTTRCSTSCMFPDKDHVDRCIMELPKGLRISISVPILLRKSRKLQHFTVGKWRQIWEQIAVPSVLVINVCVQSGEVLGKVFWGFGLLFFFFARMLMWLCVVFIYLSKHYYSHKPVIHISCVSKRHSTVERFWSKWHSRV